MTRLAFVLALAAALPALAEGANDAPRRLADDSRWASFVHLVDARWRQRTEVPQDDEAGNRRRAGQCAADAWYLSLPSLVGSREAPCEKLVATLPEPPGAKAREAEKKRAAFLAKFRRKDASPTRDEYAACTSDAIAAADAALLEVCALALSPRAALVASLSDDDRFGGWLASCKRAMLEPGDAPADGGTRAHSPEADEEARHCLRTLPTLYEVQWLKKVSDFWSPEELQALRRRTEELGRDAAP